jgi:hypothetical protein
MQKEDGRSVKLLRRRKGGWGVGLARERRRPWNKEYEDEDGDDDGNDDEDEDDEDDEDDDEIGGKNLFMSSILNPATER